MQGLIESIPLKFPHSLLNIKRNDGDSYFNYEKTCGTSLKGCVAVSKLCLKCLL